MATGLSAGLDSSVLKTILGFVSGQFTAPTVCGISLHSAALGTAKVIASEWSNGGAANTNYTARLSVGVGTSNWTVAAFAAGTGCIATNSVQVAFTALTGTGNNVVAVGFNDSLTIGAGTLDWFADVTSTAIAAGIIVQFNVGDISLTLL
jgi:hypothetical protein